jgi:C_GCAxxG_C_C family probable redox protein
MNSRDKMDVLSDLISRAAIDRRAFFSKSVACTTGLTLLAFPEIQRAGFAAQQLKSKEEIFKGLEAKAAKFMKMYGSCAKSSFAALNEQFEMKADQVVPAIMPLTGGIAGKGETCGAVSGSLLAIGYFFESLNRAGNQQPGFSMKLGGMFFDGFQKEFGSTRCREVVKHQYGRYYDFAKPEDQTAFFEQSKKADKCLEVVTKAIVLAATIILENWSV